MPCLVFFSTTHEVPEPTKRVKDTISFIAACQYQFCDKFCIGCSVFSGIEQYGMVISSQKLDEYINYYFIYFINFWDFYSLYRA